MPNAAMSNTSQRRFLRSDRRRVWSQTDRGASVRGGLRHIPDPALASAPGSARCGSIFDVNALAAFMQPHSRPSCRLLPEGLVVHLVDPRSPIANTRRCFRASGGPAGRLIVFRADPTAGGEGYDDEGTHPDAMFNPLRLDHFFECFSNRRCLKHARRCHTSQKDFAKIR